jgi:hypothetical protein
MLNELESGSAESVVPPNTDVVGTETEVGEGVSGESDRMLVNASGEDINGVPGREFMLRLGVRLRESVRAGDRGGRGTGDFRPISDDVLDALFMSSSARLSPDFSTELVSADVEGAAGGLEEVGVLEGMGTPDAAAAARSTPFSPSTTRKALTSASFCLRSSSISSLISAAFIRSCATILFAYGE